MSAHEPEDSLAAAAAFQIGVAIVGPLSARLDLLVQRAHDSGERTSRKELLAALILAAPENDEAISRLVRRYRRATIQDAFITGEDPAEILDPVRPRGPRRTPPTRRAPLPRHRRRRRGGSSDASPPPGTDD